MPSWLTLKLIGGLVAALILLGLVAERGRWMHRAHSAEAQAAADCTAIRKASNRPKLDCKEAPQQIEFLGDALNAVSARTEAARAADAAHAREVESQQNIASQESSHDYQAELARVRADYADRLRRAAARGTDQGSSGKPPVPGASASARGPDAAAPQDGLPSEDALIATEQALQLSALQSWACKVGVAKCPSSAASSHGSGN